MDPQCKQEQTLGTLDTRLDARRQKRTQAKMDSLEDLLNAGNRPRSSKTNSRDANSNLQNTSKNFRTKEGWVCSLEEVVAQPSTLLGLKNLGTPRAVTDEAQLAPLQTNSANQTYAEHQTRVEEVAHQNQL